MIAGLFAASLLSGLPPSKAVLTAYDMASNKGELHLDPTDGRVISPDKSPLGFPFYLFGRAVSATTIYLNYPKGTSITIATYRPKYPQQIATACVLFSRSISPADAYRGFLSSVQAPDVSQDLNPARPGPLEIDRPKEGYRKSVLFPGGKLVILETDLYKEAH